MELGLLLIRILLALILFTHATQKLVGWFSGNGIGKQSEIFSSLGLRPGRLMVLTAGTTELVAAVLLLIGVLTPLGALLAAGTMTVAGVTMQMNSGKFWNVAGGGEYPYVLAVLAVSLAFTGAGALSLDAVLMTRLGGVYTLMAEPTLWVGAAVIAISAVSALPFALLVKRHRLHAGRT